MPGLTWLAMHKPEFTDWQVLVLIAVAIFGVAVIMTVIVKSRKW